jgi:SnoaL-like domain
MLTRKLSGSVAAYVDGANAHDANAVAACFNGGAVVWNEGRQRQGIAAIRERAEEVSTGYGPTVDVVDLVETNSRTTVTGRGTGPFPGSPIDLRCVLALHRKKMARPEIS